MKLFGIEWYPPRVRDISIALMITTVIILVGVYLLIPAVGGNKAHIAGMAISAGLGWVMAASGATIDKAGFRGFITIVCGGLASYLAVIVLFGK